MEDTDIRILFTTNALSLEQWYSNFSLRVSPDVIYFQLSTSKVVDV
jgi:hypothetical protein